MALDQEERVATPVLLTMQLRVESFKRTLSHVLGSTKRPTSLDLCKVQDRVLQVWEGEGQVRSVGVSPSLASLLPSLARIAPGAIDSLWENGGR